MIPFTVRQKLNGRDSMEVSILNVDVNTPIDDTLFQMPEQPPQPRATVRPQDDFYRYVNGTWLKTTKIPADKPDYGSFAKLSDDSEARLRGIDGGQVNLVHIQKTRE